MKLAKWVLYISFIGNTAFADDIHIIGTINYPLKTPVTVSQSFSAAPLKQITLLKIKLSEPIKKVMAKRFYQIQSSDQSLINSFDLPSQVQLGMNNVPVLDQGRHGTCATFAATGAVNAALNKGDYVSQLCLLQLGNFLEPTTYIPSGWQGSNSGTLLDEMSMFGVVSKLQQTSKGCGGLKSYPVEDGRTPKTPLIPSTYHSMSTSIKKLIEWKAVIDGYSLNDLTDLNQLLLDVKTTLNTQARLSFGVILVDLHVGTIGAVGKYHTGNDTWLLTPEIEKDAEDFFNGNNPNFEYAAHGMIITGYDDNAIAIDNKGRPHKGLFTLRNSWGKTAGDQGNYYMSYRYFLALVTHAEGVRAIKSKS